MRSGRSFQPGRHLTIPMTLVAVLPAFVGAQATDEAGSGAEASLKHLSIRTGPAPAQDALQGASSEFHPGASP